MTQIEKIKAEIERQKEIHFKDYHINKNGNSADYGACNALTQLLSFIDSLEEPVSNDLEEAAKNYEEDAIFYAARRISDFFKAGAEWQKEKMMEDAVDGEIYFSMDMLQYRIITEPLGNFHHGDKVKLIIIMEE